MPWSRKSRAIPLLPPLAVQPVQSLSACTVELYLFSPHGPYGLYRASVTVQYSYTSTPPMGRTACTEPQFLYSRAIPLLPPWAVRPVQSLSSCTVQLYLYSPHWPYSLYRASVPVQGCTLPFFITITGQFASIVRSVITDTSHIPVVPLTFMTLSRICS